MIQLGIVRIGILGGLLLAFLLLQVPETLAETAAQLQTKINTSNQEIATLEKEIAEYQTKLNTTYEEGQTLKSAIAGLYLTQKKLQSSINLTQKKIDTTTLEITSLGGQIVDKESRIRNQKAALEESLRELQESDDISLIESLLIYKRLADLWNNVATIGSLQSGIKTHVADLTDLKENLTEAKTESEKKKKELVGYQRQLVDQKKIVQINKAEKDKLLKQTKNLEANYRSLLAEKEAKRDAFETELFNYESALKLIFDPGSIPSPGKGMLRWPLDQVYVTQRFGVTSFSLTHPQVYNGHGHSGIDLRASEGTPVKAALAGIVEGVGNTDIACPDASYGEWVLIRHDNGLTTLYPHLSLIRVVEGQSVGTGNVIGYSGSTGYATGPHLHFAVFASQGVHVSKPGEFRSKTCGTFLKLPIAGDPKAYLNPLSYL